MNAVELTCEYCGNKQMISAQVSGRKKYCNSKCADGAFKKRQRDKTEELEKICLGCKSTFKTKSITIKYCNQFCRRRCEILEMNNRIQKPKSLH